ncbi:MAG TPA: hypothetical protein VL501_02885 [Pyrinomonadaceae bacterium]|nr:hypothetical protein [Pyrinomonadaceae bacterium]
MKVFGVIVSGFLIFVVCSPTARAQGFNGIIPLKSDCSDVERIFHVETCTAPSSTYLLKNYWVTVTVASDIGRAKVCYKVPAGTITTIHVSYNNRVPIEKFGIRLKREVRLSSDLNGDEYSNSSLGVSAVVINGLVSDATFGPTPKNHRLFARKCPGKGR